MKSVIPQVHAAQRMVWRRAKSARCFGNLAITMTRVNLARHNRT